MKTWKCPTWYMVPFLEGMEVGLRVHIALWNVTRRSAGILCLWNSLGKYNTPQCLFSFALLHSPIDERTSTVHEGNVRLSETLTFLNVFSSTVVIFQQSLCRFPHHLSLLPVVLALQGCWCDFHSPGRRDCQDLETIIILGMLRRWSAQDISPIAEVQQSKAEAQSKNRSSFCGWRAFPPPGKVAGERGVKHRYKLSFKLHPTPWKECNFPGATFYVNENSQI